MKDWSAKRDSDGKVVILLNTKDPEAILNKMPDGPYTLIGECDVSTLASRKWRDSWKDDESGGIEVDMVGARAQKMQEIRAKRDEMLDNSDKKWVEATTKGEASDVSDIEADKVALRDMAVAAQAAVDAETDPDNLESMDAFSGLSLNKVY